MSEQPPLTIKQQRDLKQELKEQRRQSIAKKNKLKNSITWVVVGAAIVGVVVIIAMSSGGSTTSGTLAAVTTDDHVHGSTTAPAVLVEYSDYQCPACGAYYPVIKELQTKYGDKLAVVYRNYPLTSLHQFAQIGAQAAEAGGLQGKYWEMHDLLFENQASWSKLGSESEVKKIFATYAAQLNLDTKKFTGDLTSSTVIDRVDRDVQSGNAISVAATPTFFLNGNKLDNPGSVTVFEGLIDAILPKT